MHQQPQIPKHWSEKQKGRRQGSVLGVFAGGSVSGAVNFFINKRGGVKAPFWERSPEAPFGSVRRRLCFGSVHFFDKQKRRRQGSVLGAFAGGSVLGVFNS